MSGQTHSHSTHFLCHVSLYVICLGAIRWIESQAKQALQKHMPTVIEPNRYKHRFVSKCDSYFASIPDHVSWPRNSQYICTLRTDREFENKNTVRARQYFTVNLRISYRERTFLLLSIRICSRTAYAYVYILLSVTMTSLYSIHIIKCYYDKSSLL